jgi:hypothetical protein
MEGHSHRPSPAMAVALIALFVALSGTATALTGTNTVTSDDIVAQNVKQSDIKAGAVTNGKLAANAISSGKVLDQTLLSADVGLDALTASDLGTDSVGSDEIANSAVGSDEIASDAVGPSKVLNDSLTGADIANTDSLGGPEINESGLGVVPAATNATNASRLDGVSAQTFNFEGAEAIPGEVTVLTLGGLTLAADCDSGPNVELFADTATNDSFISSFAGGSQIVLDNNWDAADARKEVQAANDGSGYLVYRDGSPSTGPGTDTITVTFAYEEDLAAAETGFACNVLGTVLGSND